jgi:NADPH-dependent curcumin reductase CurA
MSQTLVLRAHCEAGRVSLEHVGLVEAAAPAEADVPPGGLLVRLLCLSADPYLRAGFAARGGRKPGEALSGFVSGEVIASRSSLWRAGELFGAHLPFCTVQVVAEAGVGALRRLGGLPGFRGAEDVSLGIGALGMPGATAYGGLIDVLRPTGAGGEVLLVTAASGAVGALVGQIAKRKFGCRVIGTAGTPEKCARLTGVLGFDAAVCYKDAATGAPLSTEQLEAAFRAAAGPAGKLDMVFENVGGPAFDAAFLCLGQGGRIAVCGSIANYNDGRRVAAQPAFDPMRMIYTAQRVEGFVCGPWLSGARGSFLQDMAAWRAEGMFIADETVFGEEKGPLDARWCAAFDSLFSGTHLGKVVVRV